MNRNLRAIIIDDEQSACDILSQLILRFCPNIEIVSIKNNLEDGIIAIKALEPDVLFLDIQMPKYAGFEIVRFFPKVNFEIIFVTAHDNYAVKAFELSAIDYLLKPVEIDKLKLAITRLHERIKQKSLQSNYDSLIANLEEKLLKRLVIPHNGDQKVLEIDQIIAFEANESYTLIHSLSGRYLVSKNLKHFERLLSENRTFFRSHKSWIVNTALLVSFSKSKLEVRLEHNVIARLSKLKKTDFESHLKSMN